MHHDDKPVSDGELDRAVAGITKAMEVGFTSIHRRFDESNARFSQVERSIGELNSTVGGHGARITDLEKRSAVDDAVLTQRDVSRVTKLGRAVWPALAALGTGLATWVAAHWKGQS